MAQAATMASEAVPKAVTARATVAQTKVLKQTEAKVKSEAELAKVKLLDYYAAGDSIIGRNAVSAWRMGQSGLKWGADGLRFDERGPAPGEAYRPPTPLRGRPRTKAEQKKRIKSLRKEYGLRGRQAYPTHGAMSRKYRGRKKSPYVGNFRRVRPGEIF